MTISMDYLKAKKWEITLSLQIYSQHDLTIDLTRKIFLPQRSLNIEWPVKENFLQLLKLALIRFC